MTDYFCSTKKQQMNYLKIAEKRWTFLASAQLYLTLSVLLGTWVIYIPQISEKLAIDEGALGLALFIGAVGSLIGLIAGNYLTHFWSEGINAFVSVLIQSAAFLAVFLSNNYLSLILFLFVFGFGGGIFQVAVNAMVTYVEKAHEINIMSTCHGFFSLGGLLASGLGTLLLVKLQNATIHVFIAVGLVLILQAVFFKHYFRIKNNLQEQLSEAHANINKWPVLIILALIALSVLPLPIGADCI